MQKYVVFIQLFLVLVLAVCCMASVDDERAGLQLLGPPPRPARFHSKAELRRYLAALRDYYAVIGRPRFGKRGQVSMDDIYDEIDYNNQIQDSPYSFREHLLKKRQVDSESTL